MNSSYLVAYFELGMFCLDLHIKICLCFVIGLDILHSYHRPIKAPIRTDSIRMEGDIINQGRARSSWDKLIRKDILL